MPETYHAGETVRDDERVADLITEIRKLANEVEHGAPGSISADELARRARQSSTPTRRLGYPPSALGGGVSSDVSDRTGETATELADLGGNSDPAKAALRKMRASLRRTIGGLDDACVALRDATRQLRSVTPKEPVDIPDVCRVCDQPLDRGSRGERCRKCYDFFQVEGVDPPEEILEARRAGKRMSERFVREVLDRTGLKGSARR